LEQIYISPDNDNDKQVGAHLISFGKYLFENLQMFHVIQFISVDREPISINTEKLNTIK